MKNSKKLNLFIFVYFPVYYIVFFPTFIFNMTLREGQLLLYLTFPLLLIFYILLGTKLVKMKNIIFILMIIFMFNFVGIIFKLNTINNISGLMGYFRYVVYSLVLFISYNIGRKLNFNENNFMVLIKSIYLFVLLFLIIQYFSNNTLTSIISNRELIGSMGLQIAGPFIWSYSLGFFLIFGYFYLLLKFVFEQYNYYTLFTFLSYCMLLIFTQSKAVYLSIFLLTLVTLFFMNFVFKITLTRKILINIIFSVLIFLLVVVVLDNIDYLYNIARFLDYFESGNIDASTSSRLNQLENVFLSLELNLYFGQPLEKVIIENAYGYYLYYFGIIGFIGYMVLLIFINFVNYRIFHYYTKLNNVKMIIISYSIFMLTLSVFIFSLASSIIDGHKTAYLFWFLLGVYYSMIYNNRKGNSNEIFKNR